LHARYLARHDVCGDQIFCPSERTNGRKMDKRIEHGQWHRDFKSGGFLPF
jgi:hypothetical protein